MFEWYASTSDKPDPSCEICCDQTKRCISQFGIVFTGPLTSKYNDKNKDGAHMDGYYAERVRSTTREDGKPEQTFISTWQEHKKFLKAEGLVNVADTGQRIVKKDGRGYESNSGMPGSWV